MVAGPIPWTAIMTYAEHVGLCGNLADHLNIVIRAMDAAYLEWQAAENDRDRKNK
jgi:hypothetical protein